MAPNRKKKKAATNPARGFATTSSVSKSKTHEDAEVVEIPTAETSKADKGGDSSHDHQVQPEEPAELRDLSPEELEHQLEESELQLFLEQYSEKSKKDASRQIAKLHAEKRLLRSQADPLIVRSWLPAELMDLIDSSLDAQFKAVDSLDSLITKTELSNSTSQDTSLARLWTLEQILIGIGIQQAKVREAILHVIRQKARQKGEQSSGKDTVWGLEESLSWLALYCNDGELPSYEAGLIKRRGSSPDGCHIEGDLNDTIIPANTQSTPRTLTPPPNRTQATISGNVEVEMQGQSSESSNDSDQDDPDAMIARFLDLQSRLYNLRPDLVDNLVNKRTTKPRNRPVGREKRDDGQEPRVIRLLQKLDKLETDILFDKDEALRQWVEIRDQLAKDAAERKRLHLDNGSTQPINGEAVMQASRSSLEPDKTHEQADENGDDILTELFSSLPELSADANTSVTSIRSSTPNNCAVTIRDFGKPMGLKPRRVFEEACKARDATCRVQIKLSSCASFSNRASLTVRWSSRQSLPLDMPTGSFNCVATSCSVRVEMESVATPDAEQAEAYVATVALFLIFSQSPKEEKAYLRLPSAWRSLWSELCKSRQESVDAIDRNILRNLRKLLDNNDQSLGQTLPSTNAKPKHCQTLQKDVENARSPKEHQQSLGSSPELVQLWSIKASTDSFKRMLVARRALPISRYRDELLQAIEENQAIIVCGETGCGKSTQVPSFILEHELSHGRHCNIYCTEPRRISAISLARRVSEELGEKRGDLGTSRSLVGYAIRLESRVAAQTRCVYATTGLVMRMLEREDELQGITHLILDEVHERTLDSDFLLVVLRRLMTRRPTLRVVLMSATVNAQRFAEYMGSTPVLNIPGRTYPVETKFLEDAVEVSQYQIGSDTYRSEGPIEEDDEQKDSTMQKDRVFGIKGYSAATCDTLFRLDEYRIAFDLIVRLLETIATNERFANYSKAILVFLPGLAEIRRLNDQLAGHPTFRSGWYICSLHSSIAMEEQEQAFNLPPDGVRKIVLSTNIAETGVTIPDITCVIDTGKHREMRFDERRQLSRLIEVFISKANAKQRRGRAGRVQNGLCFHLFTRARHDEIMAEEQTPEMLRLSLQDLILRVKIFELGGIEDTLAEALDPPSSKTVRRAIGALIDVKALTAAEDLTVLGRQLAKLPLDVFLGKLIMLGSIFKCLDATLTIAAILTSKSPFSAPMNARAQADLARLSFKRGDSDLLTAYNAYCAWRRIRSHNRGFEHQFCRKNFLSQPTLSSIEDLKIQLADSLYEAGYLTLNDEEIASLKRTHFKWRDAHVACLLNRYSTNNENDIILNSVIAWSFYPKLLRAEGKGWRNVANNQSIKLHPSTVNKSPAQDHQWLSFYHIMQSNNKSYNAHETSTAEDFAIALVCGDAEFKMYAGVIVIDGNRIRFHVDDWRSMLALKHLRLKIREIITQAFRNPGRWLNYEQGAWFDIWQQAFAHKATNKRLSHR